MRHMQGNGYEGRSGVEQGLKKRNGKICAEKEIQTEVAGSNDIRGVYHQIKVEMQLRELNKEDGHRCLVHSLRMTRIHTIG